MSGRDNSRERVRFLPCKVLIKVSASLHRRISDPCTSYVETRGCRQQRSLFPCEQMSLNSLVNLLIFISELWKIILCLIFWQKCGGFIGTVDAMSRTSTNTSSKYKHTLQIAKIA